MKCEYQVQSFHALEKAYYSTFTEMASMCIHQCLIISYTAYKTSKEMKNQTENLNIPSQNRHHCRISTYLVRFSCKNVQVQFTI